MIALYFDYTNIKTSNQRYPSRCENFIVYGPSTQKILNAAKSFVASCGEGHRIDTKGSISVDTSLLNNEGCGVNWEHLKKVVDNASRTNGKVFCLFVGCQAFAALGDSSIKTQVVSQYYTAAIPHLDDPCRTVYLASGYDNLKDALIAPVYLMIEGSFKDAIVRFLKSDGYSGYADIWVGICDQIHPAT